MTYLRYSSILLRIGLASVFLYAAIASFIEPENWIGYMPVMLRNLLPGDSMLQIFSLIEIALSVWLLSGWKVLYSAGVSAVMMVGIVLTNFGAIDIVFRDIAIFFMAVALGVQSLGEKKH